MSFQKSTLVKELYVSRQNLLTYLKNQHYDVSKYESFNISEINAMKQNSMLSYDSAQLNFEVQHEDDEEKKCSIIYYLKSSMKQSILEGMIMDYYSENDKEKCSLIIITMNPMNDSTIKTLKQTWKKYQEYVAMFDIPGLLFNILEHSFVPKHVKLNNEQKQEIYKKYNIGGDDQLPEISVFDPVARALLMRPGELCEITRYDKISLSNVFYRLCVV
jgi:DNA-directed RNA polymerase subunit H (RpoH/RPB5)